MLRQRFRRFLLGEEQVRWRLLRLRGRRMVGRKETVSGRREKTSMIFAMTGLPTATVLLSNARYYGSFWAC